MGFINKQKQKWKALPKREKAKIVIGFINDICTGCVFGLLGTRIVSDDDGLGTKALVGVGMFGMGLAASDLTSQTTDKLVDAWYDAKEDTANGGA